MQPAEEKQLTREQLAALIWAAPLAQVAHELGTTPYHLKKLCRWLNLSPPPKGHWSKIEQIRVRDGASARTAGDPSLGPETGAL